MAAVTDGYAPQYQMARNRRRGFSRQSLDNPEIRTYREQFYKIKQQLRRVAPQFEFLISDAEQPIRVVSAKSTIAPKAALRNVSGGLRRERCRRGTRV
jgi:hypothetical protein